LNNTTNDQFVYAKYHSKNTPRTQYVRMRTTEHNNVYAVSVFTSLKTYTNKLGELAIGQALCCRTVWLLKVQ